MNINVGTISGFYYKFGFHSFFFPNNSFFFTDLLSFHPLYLWRLIQSLSLCRIALVSQTSQGCHKKKKPKQTKFIGINDLYFLCLAKSDNLHTAKTMSLHILEFKQTYWILFCSSVEIHEAV